MYPIKIKINFIKLIFSYLIIIFFYVHDIIPLLYNIKYAIAKLILYPLYYKYLLNFVNYSLFKFIMIHIILNIL